MRTTGLIHLQSRVPRRAHAGETARDASDSPLNDCPRSRPVRGPPPGPVDPLRLRRPRLLGRGLARPGGRPLRVAAPRRRRHRARLLPEAAARPPAALSARHARPFPNRPPLLAGGRRRRRLGAVPGVAGRARGAPAGPGGAPSGDYSGDADGAAPTLDATDACTAGAGRANSALCCVC